MAEAAVAVDGTMGGGAGEHSCETSGQTTLPEKPAMPTLAPDCATEQVTDAPPRVVTVIEVGEVHACRRQAAPGMLPL